MTLTKFNDEVYNFIQTTYETSNEKYISDRYKRFRFNEKKITNKYTHTHRTKQQNASRTYRNE